MFEILKQKTLLIVDDEADLREPLVQEFESLGCKVFQAKNGHDAYEIVLREKIDAVISDIRMPGGDGIEFLKRVKLLHHECPMVMLITGFSDLSHEEAFDLGAEAVLSKPFDLDAIDEAVVKILTPKNERWKTPVVEARIKCTIERSFLALDQAIAEGGLALGRGGFFLKEFAIPARGEMIKFQIRFQAGEILTLEGNGILRWSRSVEDEHLPLGCGIEFEYLSEEVRSSIIALIEKSKLVPFIPKGPPRQFGNVNAEK
jgi:CheY-like chemotaxis protein